MSVLKRRRFFKGGLAGQVVDIPHDFTAALTVAGRGGRPGGLVTVIYIYRKQSRASEAGGSGKPTAGAAPYPGSGGGMARPWIGEAAGGVGGSTMFPLAFPLRCNRFASAGPATMTGLARGSFQLQ